MGKSFSPSPEDLGVGKTEQVNGTFKEAAFFLRGFKKGDLKVGEDDFEGDSRDTPASSNVNQVPGSGKNPLECQCGEAIEDTVDEDVLLGGESGEVVAFVGFVEEMDKGEDLLFLGFIHGDAKQCPSLSKEISQSIHRLSTTSHTGCWKTFFE